MRPLYFLFIGILMSLSACSSLKKVSKDETPEFSFLEPISYIYFVDKKGNELLSDSLSIINRDLLEDMVSQYSNDRIYIESDSLHYLTLSAIENMTNQVLEGALPASLKVPNTIYPVLDQSESKYTIGMLSDGFILDKKRYRKELLWTSLLSIADENGEAIIPTKHGSHLYCIIINNQTKQVETFESINFDSHNPTSSKTITKQINILAKRLRKHEL